jgi:hypothetical protein
MSPDTEPDTTPLAQCPFPEVHDPHRTVVWRVTFVGMLWRVEQCPGLNGTEATRIGARAVRSRKVVAR